LLQFSIGHLKGLKISQSCFDLKGRCCAVAQLCFRASPDVLLLNHPFCGLFFCLTAGVDQARWWSVLGFIRCQ